MRDGSSSRLLALALVGSWLALGAPARGDDPDEPPQPQPRARRTGLVSRIFSDFSSATARNRPGGPPPALPPSTQPPALEASAGPPPIPDGIPPSPNLPAPRLVPQPRVSRPVTEADPLLTRVAIGRSDNGARFGLFLQVFADGTVLDSEGVHHVDREALRPLVQAILAADPARLKGHCGGPPTDFIEQVHVVAYERTIRGLKANAFSYSGNPQGCDPAVRNLHAVIDAFQARLSSSTTPTTPAPPIAPPPGSDAAPPPPPVSATPSIPLTPPS